MLSTRASATSAQPARGLTEVQGIKVGHHTLTERPTGCTVILVDGDGAVGGVSQRGGAPGTRETDLLDPSNMVDKVNAIVLVGRQRLRPRRGAGRRALSRRAQHRAGRSAPASCRSCRRRSCSTSPFGGKPKIRPTADCGYKAAQAATDGPVGRRQRRRGRRRDGRQDGHGPGDEGRRSARRRSRCRTASSSRRSSRSTPSATSSIRRPGRSSPACAREDGKSLADVRKLLRSGALLKRAAPRAGENTTIGLVATNARLTKAEINRVALMADDGFARAISPSHTVGDGDTVFALATGRWDGEANVDHHRRARRRSDGGGDRPRRRRRPSRSNGVPAARELGTVPARFK